LRDAFSVLFFVSVGMLFDPRVLMDEPLRVLVVVAIILVGKTVAAVGLVLAFRYPLNTALTVGASLAQIGEFSFILAGLGLSLGLLSLEGQNLILAGALISIALNALLFAAIGPAQSWARARSAWARKLDLRDDPLAALPMSTDRKLLSDQVVLVGYGRVGKHIAATLDRAHIHYVVADSNREVVEALRKRGKAAVTGDASDPIVLVQAHITKAAMLVVTIPDPVSSRKMVDIARKLNPDIEAVLRSETEDGAALLRKEKLGEVFVAEQELAVSMARHVAGRLTEQPAH
jgi:CPA2 family monovalent cation:H+ antiporter-2